MLVIYTVILYSSPGRLLVRLIFGILCACVLVLTNQEVNLDVMRSTSIIYILGYFFLYTSSSVVTGDTIQCSRCLKNFTSASIFFYLSNRGWLTLAVGVTELTQGLPFWWH